MVKRVLTFVDQEGRHTIPKDCVDHYEETTEYVASVPSYQRLVAACLLLSFQSGLFLIRFTETGRLNPFLSRCILETCAILLEKI